MVYFKKQLHSKPSFLLALFPDSWLCFYGKYNEEKSTSYEMQRHSSIKENENNRLIHINRATTIDAINIKGENQKK